MASKLPCLRRGINSPAKMGSSQDGITPLSRLTLGNHRWRRVRVRVSRMWVASNPLTGTVFGLDCLLIDAEGRTMQARAHPSNMRRLQQQLVEGKIYALSDFAVCPRLNKYMACRNSLMIQMGAQTVVEEMEEDTGSPIPTHTFEFVDFKEVPLRIGDDSLFIDVIGKIESIEDMGKTWKWGAWRNISFRNIHLHDLSGNNLKVALFGDLGRSFDAEQVRIKGQQTPVVAIFAGMRVRWYPEIKLTVCSSSASKYYLDLKIPEVHRFRASLHGPHISIGQLPCRVQNPINPTELVNQWRTIKQLKILDEHDFQNPIFLCRTTLKGIDCTKGWWYWSCYICKKSITDCIEGCSKKWPPVRWYKLDALMEDATGTMNVMIFGEVAQELIGEAAEEIAEDVTAEKISDVVGSCGRREFAVAFENGNFVVKCVLNDDMLQLLRSAQVAPEGGDGLLSQEEASSESSSYTCSPKVKKEENMKMMEKRREPKRLKMTDEVDQTNDTKGGS